MARRGSFAPFALSASVLVAARWRCARPLSCRPADRSPSRPRCRRGQSRSSPSHDRRPGAGPPARRNRRQGPVRQGDRGGTGRPAYRSGSALAERSGDLAPRRACDRLRVAARRPPRCAVIDARRRLRCPTERTRKSGLLRCGATLSCCGTAPICAIVPIRGNVNTRMRKLNGGEVDAIVLALCGLERLGEASARPRSCPVKSCCPRLDKGALAVECRAADEMVASATGAASRSR